MVKTKEFKKENFMAKLMRTLNNFKSGLLALIILIQANPLILASAAPSAADRAKKTVNGALSILFLIMSVVGVLFIMYGLAKWIMAHSQSDGPGINSAMMFIAAGLGLILGRFILKAMELADWIDVELIQ